MSTSDESIIAGKPFPENPICDFCTSPEVAWVYRVAPSRQEMALIENGKVRGVLDSIDDDAWLTCDICYCLIETNKREELAQRSLFSTPIDHTWKQREIDLSLQAVRLFHNQFYNNRKGDPEPYEKAETTAQ